MLAMCRGPLCCQCQTRVRISAPLEKNIPVREMKCVIKNSEASRRYRMCNIMHFIVNNISVALKLGAEAYGPQSAGGGGEP